MLGAYICGIQPDGDSSQSLPVHGASNPVAVNDRQLSVRRGQADRTPAASASARPPSAHSPDPLGRRQHMDRRQPPTLQPERARSYARVASSIQSRSGPPIHGSAHSPIPCVSIRRVKEVAAPTLVPNLVPNSAIPSRVNSIELHGTRQHSGSCTADKPLVMKGSGVRIPASALLNKLLITEDFPGVAFALP
jgi:hypothetical protein